MFKVNNKDTRTMSMTSFWLLYCYLKHILHLFLVFTVDFEQLVAEIELIMCNCREKCLKRTPT